MRTEHQNQARREALQTVRTEVEALIEYLHSAKFCGVDSNGERKDWVSTEDMLLRLRELRSVALDPVLPTM